MATVRISQLTAITTPTDDDVLVINDADTNTRKITFGNLTAGLLNTTGSSQTKSGGLTIGGTLVAQGNLVVDTNALVVDSTNDYVGIRTATPDEAFDVDGNIRVRNQGIVQFGDSNNSNYVGLRAPSAVATDFSLTLPSALPATSTGNFITYDSAGLGSFDSNTSYTGNELRAPYIGAKGVGSNSGELRLYELPSNGGSYVSLQAPTTLAGVTYYTLPGAYPGSNGFVLSSTTTGALSWVSNGAAASGSNGEIQFNSSGSLGSDVDLSFNSGTNTLSVPNLSLSGTLQGATEVAFSKTITASGTTGAQTINNVCGSVNFAAAATSLVVTNSLVTSNSVIIATVATNDATMTSVQVAAGTGSFTIYANAAATAETRVNFLVVN
jgi:hypothetical protein